MKILAIIGIIISLSISSCSLRETCGIVTGYGQDLDGDHYVMIDGVREYVSQSIYLRVEIGEHWCITN
tara:strand:- start:12 stop:215 length:204 start_codon:yes stop_codon:yes gene_type:complete